MIVAPAPADTAAVGRHYDELDPFYRALWGEHLHHGLWTDRRDSAETAALRMVDEVAERAGVRPGTRVCDVGCGYGATSRALANRGADVTGLTVSARQHRVAVAAAPDDGRCTVLLRDWLENGLDDASFDVVIAIESLSHMASVPAALAEAQRVLRPGGRLVLCVWLAGPSPRPWEVRHLLVPICQEGRLPGLPDAGDYAGWLEAAGFIEPSIDDVTARVARTWTVCVRRVAGAALRPTGWRYLADRRNVERRFPLTVIRIMVAYRTGGMRYGIITARKPAQPEE